MKLRRTVINLHINRKRMLLQMTSFSVISFVLCCMFIFSTKYYTAQLNGLVKSKYNYSAIIQSTEKYDCYYQFDAGLCFMKSLDSNKTIRSENIMQVSDADYTKLVYWNAKKLLSNEIAVSQGLASKLGLRKGDVLFSKHIVKGEIGKYYIKQIVPDVETVRVQKNKEQFDGIIIMGYDSSYVDNITYNTLLFTDKSVEELSQNKQESPIEIIFRDDEIVYICIEIIKYYMFFVIALIIVTILFVIGLKKNIYYNYRRCIILGYKYNDLNKTYYVYVLGSGLIALLLLLVMLLSLMVVDGINIIKILLILSIFAFESLALLIKAILVKKELWRG